MWTIEFYKHVETRRPYNGARLNKSFASVRINKTGNNCLIKDLLCKKNDKKKHHNNELLGLSQKFDWFSENLYLEYIRTMLGRAGFLLC